MNIQEQTRIAEVVFGGGDNFFDLSKCSIYLAGLDGVSIDDCPLWEAAWIAAQTAARRPVTLRYREEEGSRVYHGMVFHYAEPLPSPTANRGPNDEPGDKDLLYAYRHCLVEVTVDHNETVLRFPDGLEVKDVPAAVGRAVGAYTARGLKTVVVFGQGRIRSIRLRMEPDHEGGW